MANRPTLYGLGVGPGDPELMTLKAHRILQGVPVIAYPAPEGKASLVRGIAASHIPHGKTEIVIETPMIPGDFPNHGVYDRYAGEIAGHLDAGRDVAVLCEGDPFFYGSFMYLFHRLAGEYETQVVPGVSSLNACAARAGWPLASRGDMLMVLPATLSAEILEARLAETQAAAIIKVGRNLDKILKIINKLGLAGNACYVEHATMAGERVLPVDGLSLDAAPYFSMILVSRSNDDAA